MKKTISLEQELTAHLEKVMVKLSANDRHIVKRAIEQAHLLGQGDGMATVASHWAKDLARQRQRKAFNEFWGLDG
jgi:hypothetical protein